MTRLQLTPRQRQAAELMKRPGTKVGGFAGVGKTICVAEAAGEIRDKIIVAAPTNRAAQVLRGRLPMGIQVMTLHSLTTTPGEIEVKDERTGKVIDVRRTFKPKAEQIREHVIVDEASMVGRSFMSKIEHLLPSYSLVGDPFQLPPVQDGQLLAEDDCDMVLRDVMRQAAESPALAYATQLRSGGGTKAPPGVNVCDGIRGKELLQMGQPEAICITYTNADRHWFNREIKKLLHSRAHWVPKEGDKLICREGDPEKGLYRGMSGRVAAILELEDDRVNVRVDWEGGEANEHVIDRRRLEGRNVPYEDRFGDQIEYGFAVTCHSAQGSSWKRVYIVPRKHVLRKNLGPQGLLRWLYTAVTRVEGDGEATIIDT